MMACQLVVLRVSWDFLVPPLDWEYLAAFQLVASMVSRWVPQNQNLSTEEVRFQGLSRNFYPTVVGALKPVGTSRNPSLKLTDAPFVSPTDFDMTT